MKILNLYAGLGGNRGQWPSEHKITAVEYTQQIADIYKANFPHDTVIVTDAHDFLLKHYKEFDFIWSSPPCQSHSVMMKATRHKVVKYPDLKLYEEIIFLRHFLKGHWIVENVKPYYEPLVKPDKVLNRHIFWSNFHIPDFALPNHPNFIKADSPAEIESLKQWLGIKYEGNIYYQGNHSPGQVLRNCVHPLTGLHILNAIPFI